MHLQAARVAVCCIVLVVSGVGLGVGVGGGLTVPGVATDGSGTVAAQESVDEEALEAYDEVRIEIDLQDNGSAVWTVSYQYRLNESESATAWEDLEADIAAEPASYSDWFEDRWEAEVAEAEAETGREMELSPVAVETETRSGVQEHGFVVFQFEWASFGMVELNRLEAGDAIDEFVLEDDMQLVLSWPDVYERSSVEPSPDDSRESTVIWNGEETDFVTDEPRVELIERNDEPTGGVEEPTTLSVGVVATAVGVLAVLAVGVGGWWLRQRSSQPPADDHGHSQGSEEQTPSSPPPPELLSNEERVLQLIDDHGGRIKQQRVVAELEWTEAKTSQVVSGLREDDRIEVFRIGRENVLTRPEDEETDSV